ncbi:hypothetical protein VCB98_11980 [Gammaproteobacteria bacterium AB-CW1]|uniref:Glycosyl transferase family 4 n=1 Tax=Natronospira elongata TaxID=3110268 RepID=A0AAP6JH36_9GAMM|nr:hypothetical protein [Gammaproteobacteria bacterium AB-CW1]
MAVLDWLLRLDAWLWTGLALLLSLGLTRLWIPLAPRLGFVDRPNHRSLHDAPTPRAGGLPLLLVALGLGFVLLRPEGALLVALLGAIVLAVVSMIDDLRGLPALPRILVQLLAALAVVLAGAWPQALSLPGGLALPLGLGVAVLAVPGMIWMSNLYNFMDGMDGFAGAMSLIGFASLAALAGLAGVADPFLLCLLLAAAAGGFLVWNWHPARIFMGDVGSVPLGFLAAALPLLLAAEGRVPLLLGLLPFAPFWLDATVTLFRRIRRRERFWQAHRSHYYQRLVRSGWSHAQASTLGAGLMLLSGGSAVLALLLWERPLAWLLLALPLLALLAAGAYVRGRE